MKVERIDVGIHTIELYANNLKYHEVQKAIDRLVKCGRTQVLKSDPYNIDRHFKSTYLVDKGIRMLLHQSPNRSNGIGFIINPSTLLKGAYQPVKLYHPTKKNCDKMLDILGDTLAEIGLATCGQDGLEYVVHPEALSLSQMDLTMNLWLDADTELTEIVRLFRKSNVPKHFNRNKCKNADVSHHCFSAQTKNLTIKAYDKVYELKQNDRCPSKLENKKMLRIEVSLKREEFLKKLNLKRKDSLYTMLSVGYQHVKEMIMGYLCKMFPCSGKHLSYRKTERILKEQVTDGILQEQMLFLVKKTSDGAGLDTATQKLKDSYKNVDNRRLKKLWTTFDKLGIHPITLPNDGPRKQIPSLIELLQDL